MDKQIRFKLVIFLFFGITINLSAQIVSISPDKAKQGQTLDIEVTANNIDFSQGTNLVILRRENSETYMKSSSVNNKTSITAIFSINSNQPTGFYDFIIRNTISNTAYTKINGFYISSDLSVATLDSISPNTAKQGDIIIITIHGSNTNFTKNAVSNTIWLKNSTKQIYATTTNAIDSVTIQAQFKLTYAHPAGTYSLFIQNDLDGTTSLNNAFDLLRGESQPSILTTTPDTLTQGHSLDIEVTAENIDFTQGTNMVSLKQGATVIHTNSAVANTSTSLTANFSFNIDHPLGNYDFYIWNTASDITLTKPEGFYLKPDLTIAAIDSISPKTAKQGDNIIITVHCKNTNFKKNSVSNIVRLKNSSNQIYPISIIPIDSVTLQTQFILTYANHIGVYSLFIQNDIDGTFSLNNGFELLSGDYQPSILTVTPDTLIQGQTLEIEVTAENTDFTQGTNVVSLRQGPTEIYMNSSKAVSPTSLTVDFTINKNNPIGKYDFYIWNSTFDITLIADQTIIKENAFYLKAGYTSIGEYNEDDFLIYPNPVNNCLYFQGNYTKIQLLDMNGRIILEAKQNRTLDVSNLHKGTYIARVFQGKKIRIKKLIIK